jgi:hypothetical protein
MAYLLRLIQNGGQIRVASPSVLPSTGIWSVSGRGSVDRSGGGTGNATLHTASIEAGSGGGFFSLWFRNDGSLRPVFSTTNGSNFGNGSASGVAPTDGTVFDWRYDLNLDNGLITLFVNNVSVHTYTYPFFADLQGVQLSDILTQLSSANVVYDVYNFNINDQHSYDPNDVVGMTGTVIPDGIGSINGVVFNVTPDDSYWVYYDNGTGNYYVTTDGVDQTIELANFTMPATGVVRFTSDAVLVPTTGGETDTGGLRVSFPSYFVTLTYGQFGELKLESDGGGANIFGYTFTDRLVFGIEFDLDLDVFRIYVNNNLEFTSPIGAGVVAGITSDIIEWGRRLTQYAQTDVYSLQIIQDAVLVHDYDPSLSGGVGLVVTDLVGDTVARLINYNPPNDDSQWVSIPAAGGVTLDGAFTLPAFTVLGDASATQPQPTIAGAFTLPALIVQADGSASLPQPEISGAFALPLLTVNADASATLPQPIVNGSFNLPLLLVNGAVTASLPQPNITGAFSVPALTVSGSASANVPQPNINGAFSLPAFLVNGTGSATTASPEINGAFDLPVFGVTGSVTATLPQPEIAGAFSLPALTVQGTGTALIPQPIINGNITLPSLIVSASGVVTLPQPEIAGAFNLPAFSVQGFATVSGLEIILDSQANINQVFLSSSINQVFKSANINQEFLSNNITYI